MRMPELKSLTRECRLRGYSQMRKTELVAAFLTIWIKIILHCAGPNRQAGLKGLWYLLLHLLPKVH